MAVTPQAEEFLSDLADSLGVSEARYEQAERSYKSFGTWLSRDDSVVAEFNPQVYVQGSFGLGTTIRPLSDAEDYDVDSVCEFHELDTSVVSQKQLKELLEIEVRSYHRAQAMTKPVRAGRRCWVLDYADGAQFHMDIVPALPQGAELRNLLEAARLDTSLAATSIVITDNERPSYPHISHDWCRSNPLGYIEWFKQRMVVQLAKRKRMLAEAAKADVADIPDYKVRTPLQAAVMILKRHRDMRCTVPKCDRPISIIITTLAAHAYESEETIGEALASILGNMGNYIAHDGDRYVIANPSDPFENFADKWEAHPERAQAFFAWLKQAQDDFAYLGSQVERQRLVETATAMAGEQMAKRAGDMYAGKLAHLSRAPSVAAAVGTGGISFPDSRRAPDNPKSFG